MNSPAPWPGPGLVLLAPGGLATPSPPLALQGLAGLLGLHLLEPAGAAADDADALLAELAARPPGWLLPLAADPGDDVAHPGCWADALAAWRQPVLLLASPGAPARTHRALLQLAGVPLVGLVQPAGEWQPELRRCDGLPWLGCLRDGDGLDLRAPLLARWLTVSGARPAAEIAPPAGAGLSPA